MPVCIANNLMLRFKEDLYSKKLSPVYISQFLSEKDKVKKHLLASFLVSKQPEGWDTAIRTYLNSVGKDSYYLGTITDMMAGVYYLENLDSPNRIKMNHLIKSALYKSENGILPPSLNSIKRMNIENKAEEDSLPKNKTTK